MSTVESGMSSPASRATARSAAPAPNKWTCHRCAKTSYVDEYRAWQAIGAVLRLYKRENKPNKRRPCRVYACPHGEGYHLTSKREEYK